MQDLRAHYAFIVFLSGYSPLGILIALQDFDFKTLEPSNGGLVIAILALFLVCTRFTAHHFKSYEGGLPVRVSDIERRSSDLLNYAIPYVAGFVDISVSEWGQMLSTLFLIWIVFYVTYKTQTVVVNPFLAELGFSMHSAVVSYPGGRVENGIIISKRQKFDANTDYKFVEIGKGYFIETK